MGDMLKYYNVRCSSCGQFDVVPEGLKTHKCSHCGVRYKVNYEDPSTTFNKDYTYQPQLLSVVCPYCNHPDIVPFGEKRHTCPQCHFPYEVIYNDATSSEKKTDNKPAQQHREQVYSPVDNSNGDKKKVTKRALLVVFIISAIIALISLLPSNEKDNLPTSRDSAVMAAVRTHLYETLKDPNSYQAIEWSPSGVNSDGLYYIRHKYRAKNSLGGYVVEQYVFFVDKNYNYVSKTPY